MSNLVEIRNNQVVVSSRQVAEKFGKEHKNVLRLLSSKMSGANKDKLSQHFYKDTYKDSTGKSNTIYYMDRDGFSFLDIGEKRLFKWLRENGYLIKARNDDYNKTTQRSMDKKLFEVNEQTYKTNFGIRLSTTPLVTPKGQLYFINKLLKLNKIKIA